VTTTTKAPELAFNDIIANFFSLGLAKSDLTATKTSFKSVLTALAVNTAQVDNYVAALQAYMAVIVQNPTAAQKTAMTDKLNLFDTAEDTFLRSFEGLNDVDGFLFKANPLNAVYNGFRTAAFAAKEALTLAPEGTYAYFTSSLTISAITDYYKSAIDVSNRIKAE
jgi:hypothetical protein